MSLDILTLGEPLVEFNEVEPHVFQRSIGGDTSNVAIAAARLGAKSGMITCLGGDSFANLIRMVWHQENVDYSACSQDDTALTGHYFITHSPTGHQFDYRRKDSASTRLKPSDIQESVIRDAKILHLSGISLAISDSAADSCFEAAAMAKKAGNLIAFDPNLRLALWPLARARHMIHGFMTHVDIALPGLGDAQALTGLSDPQDIIAFYHKLGCKIVALTMGTEGCLISEGKDRQHIAIPPKPVEAVDATGAGDCFDGAFLTRYAQSGDVEKAGHFANAAAALSVTGYGAVAPLPHLDTVESFMR